MRVGVVTTSYPREPGDPAGHFVAGFTRWLSERGARVEVIAAGPGSDFADGISITRVPGRSLFYEGGAPDRLASQEGGAVDRLRVLEGAARFQMELRAAVEGRAGSWDGVVSHWVAPSALAVESSFSWRRRAAELRRLGARQPRHLAIAHSSDVWLLRRSMIGRAALAAISRRTDLVYSSRQLVVEGAPGRVVPMGTDLDVASPVARAAARSRIGLPVFASDEETALPKLLVVLFVGRLVPIKGLDLLLTALPRKALLLVGGDGPMRKTWEDQARGDERIRFLGELRGERKRDALASADVLVIPSRALPDGRTEGTPTVIFEGFAAGLPIVATRSGGIADVMTHGREGFLVEPRAEALRSALQRLATDPLLRCSMAAASRLAAPRHAWSEVGPRLAGSLLDPSP